MSSNNEGYQRFSFALVGQEKYDESDEDFLDEFGNVKEPDEEDGEDGDGSGSDNSDSVENQGGGSSGKRKRKKNKKKKKKRAEAAALADAFGDRGGGGGQAPDGTPPQPAAPQGSGGPDRGGHHDPRGGGGKRAYMFAWTDHDAPRPEGTGNGGGGGRGIKQSPIVGGGANTREADNQFPQKMLPNIGLEEPHFSCLGHLEQEVFLSLMDKFQFFQAQDFSKMTEDDAKDLEKLRQLRDLVKDEQDEFQQFAKNAFLQVSFRHSGGGLRAEIKRYIDEYYEHRLRRVAEMPRIYEQARTILRGIQRFFLTFTFMSFQVKGLKDPLLRLVPPSSEHHSGRPQFEMRPEKNLAEMGVIPKALIPSRMTISRGYPPLRVPCQYDKLCAKIPTDPKLAWLPQQQQPTPKGEDQAPAPAAPNLLEQVDCSRFLHNSPVSRDPNAERLAVSYLPAVVLSASSLKVLMDNFGPNFDSPWTIPFSVRTYCREEGGKVLDVQKVVFLDKPLPRRSLSAKEKSEWYHKVAAKAFLLHPWTRSRKVPSKGKESPDKIGRGGNGGGGEEEGDLFFASESISDLETFGNSSADSSALLQQMDGNASGDDTDGSEDEDDGDKLVIATEESTADEEEPPAKTEGRRLRSRQKSGGGVGNSQGGPKTRLKRVAEADPVSPQAAESPPPPQRKRGRPPKKRNLPPGAATSRATSASEAETSAATAAEEEEDGRRTSRRLRRRVDSGEVGNKVPEGLPPKKRGRRKAIPISDDDDEDEEVQFKVELTVPKLEETSDAEERNNCSRGKDDEETRRICGFQDDHSAVELPSTSGEEEIERELRGRDVSTAEEEHGEVEVSQKRRGEGDATASEVGPARPPPTVLIEVGQRKKKEEEEQQSSSGNVDQELNRVQAQHSSPFKRPAPSQHVQNMVALLERRKEEKREFHRKKEQEKASSAAGGEKSFLGGIMAAQETLLDKTSARAEEERKRRMLQARARGAQYQGEKVACFDEGLSAVDFRPPCEGGNVSYRLWNLWDKAAPEASNMRIILRCSTHGIVR